MHTYIHTYRWPTGSQRAIHKHIQADKYIHTHITYTHPYWQAYTYKARQGICRHNDIHSGMHTHRQTGSQSVIHTYRQRQAYIHTVKHTEIHIHTHIVTHIL